MQPDRFGLMVFIAAQAVGWLWVGPGRRWRRRMMRPPCSVAKQQQVEEPVVWGGSGHRGEPWRQQWPAISQKEKAGKILQHLSLRSADMRRLWNHTSQ